MQPLRYAIRKLAVEGSRKTYNIPVAKTAETPIFRLTGRLRCQIVQSGTARSEKTFHDPEKVRLALTPEQCPGHGWIPDLLAWAAEVGDPDHDGEVDYHDAPDEKMNGPEHQAAFRWRKDSFVLQRDGDLSQGDYHAIICFKPIDCLVRRTKVSFLQFWNVPVFRLHRLYLSSAAL